MPRRTRIDLQDLASWPNLFRAFHRAVRGKRCRPEVRRFEAGLDRELSTLQREILSGSVEVGRSRVFQIRDPKLRTIHAPVFKERVLHHALMAYVEPVIERCLVDDSFACRPDKGALKAVERAQQHSRRFAWYLKVDIRGYFAHIRHHCLLSKIERLIKGEEVLDLCARILAAHGGTNGIGLPIGALTSQHFANLYLGSLDRLLLEEHRVSGMVRYMDDVTWWCESRSAARNVLEPVKAHLSDLGLEIKPGFQLQKSVHGLSLCGFRVFPQVLRLSKRRRLRFTAARARWESMFVEGRIDTKTLQQGMDSAIAITHGADAVAWRRESFRRVPAPEA